MKANQDVEKVYELLEQFDFNELSKQDKSYVLSIISVDEYNNLRSTLKNTERFFSNSEELTLSDSIYKSLILKSKNGNIILKFLKQPIQLYKVAASVIVFVGLYSFIHFTNLHEKNNTLASNDTIYIFKTDTLYSKFVDTVRLIKEKIVYLSREKDQVTPDKLLSNAKYECDSNKEICPNDIDKIKDLAFRNNVSNDTLFKN
ncbi:MAG: hypothetical protein ABR927_14775 [Bacteroidales bacterium]|jgi:hypothetical protein